MIVIHGLTKKYQAKDKDEEVVALDDLALFLPDKGFIAIYGASGCGKSTLLNILGGLDVPDTGTMIVNGRDTSKFAKKDWDSYRNQEVGFIFQNYFLLPHLNVFDNIAITLQMSKQTEGMKDKIQAALKQVELQNFSKRYPKQLSGGQQQRVAIARALVTNPSIILADEPTGALDEKSSISVMKHLKKVSEDHLVVMVTHNERMAREYADRMIEISYGKIVGDELIQQETDQIENLEPLKKVHLPFSTSVKWSARNVLKKKSRSIPIAIASAIGLAAVGIVLSMTRGVNEYVKDAQKAAIQDYPLYVACYPKNSAESATNDLEEFPNTSDIIIEKSDYTPQEHYISMQDDFMSYMEKMPKDNYLHYSTNVERSFNVLTRSADKDYSGLLRVSSTSYMECIAPANDSYAFIKDQYDILAGHLPESINDLVLVVDTYNRVDLQVLKNMGFDTSGDRITSEDVLKQEYRIIGNDDFYEKVHVNPETNLPYYTRKTADKFDDLWENHSLIELQVCGIIRAKHESPNPLYGTKLLYSPDLISDTGLLAQNTSESQIVKELMAEPVNKEKGRIDVLSGVYFEDINSSGYNITANYQYESRLVDVGYRSRITAIYYYTATFEQRKAIISYIDKYIQENKIKKDSNIILKTRDYLESVTQTFSSLTKTFSTILLVFSLVSILISAILTAILTYISVLERKREIGLLRSLGARRRDVSFMFIVEAGIVGLVAGIAGVALCYALAPAVSSIVVNLVSMADSSILAPTPATFSHIQLWLIPVLLVVSLIISVASALIPAIIAGNKKPAEALKE